MVEAGFEFERCSRFLGGPMCAALGGGGADAGDVGEGGDVSHTDQRSGEVDAAAGHASASGHAQVHEHHQGVARLWLHSV